MPERGRPLSVGVEIEALALNADHDEPRALLNKIEEELRENKIEARVGSRDLPPKAWGLEEDASVKDPQAQGQAQGQGQGQGQALAKVGMEFISPPWSAMAGNRDNWHREIRCLLDVVSKSDFGFEVNQTAGLHVHTGAGVTAQAEFSLDEVKKVVKLFLACEATIDGYHAQHRVEGSYLTYIQSNASVPRLAVLSRLAINQEIDKCDDFDTLYNLVNPGNPDTWGRYYKMNLRSIALRNTIEFRQHKATLSSVEVCAWADFVLAFVHKALGMSDRELARVTASTNQCGKLVDALRASTGWARDSA